MIMPTIDYVNDPLVKINYKTSTKKENSIGSIEFVTKSGKKFGLFGEENNENKVFMVHCQEKSLWTQFHIELNEDGLPSKIKYQGQYRKTPI